MKYGHLIKSISHYLLMVGIPLLGVLVILQLGTRLKAPVSVRGEWKLEISGSRDCLLSGQPAEAPVLKISQSGPDLQLDFSSQPGEKLASKLDGQTLRTVGTDGETTLALVATINRDSEPDRLEADITAPGCPAPVHFSATRLPQSETNQPSH